MSDVELARDHLEHAHHATEHPADHLARNVSLVIGALAAALALSEMAERSYQNEYLTEHISISDDWGFYGFKSTRGRMAEQNAAILRALPSAGTPETQAAITDVQQYARRQREGEPGSEGTKQIEERLQHRIAERNHALHSYELFEYVNGLLQIAIVLASVAIVTRIRTLAFVGGGLGLIAGVFGLLVRVGIV